MEDQISQAIREKRARLAELDAERDRLIAELEEWRSLLGDLPDRKKTKNKVHKRRAIRERSTVDWAYKVLKHGGHAIPVDDLIKGIEEISGLNVRRSTLVSNLSRYVQAGDTFTRPEPGVYGLKEFE